MVNFVNFILVIVPIVLFIFGLFLTKRLGFNGGFYFCLIMIIHQIYSFTAPLFTNNFLDYYIGNNNSIPFGLSLGELMIVITFIPRTIELVALGFLIYGFYQVWKKTEASKLNSSNTSN